MQPSKKFQDFALLLLRIILAAIFLYAGYMKLGFWSAAPAGVPAGMVILVKFLSITEPLGGIALIIGFLTRLAAKCLAIIMFGSLFFVHFMMHAAFFTSQQGAGMDFNVLIFAGCITVAAFGAGSWSVDRLQKRV